MNVLCSIKQTSMWLKKCKNHHHHQQQQQPPPQPQPQPQKNTKKTPKKHNHHHHHQQQQQHVQQRWVVWQYMSDITVQFTMNDFEAKDWAYPPGNSQFATEVMAHL